MRKLILPIAALLIVGFIAASQSAPLGNQFCVGVKTPQELADIVADALRQDPRGLMMLDPARCHRAKPARPVDYFDMFKVDDPSEKDLQSVADLPRYLRTLVIQKAPAGRFWMACLKQSARSTSGWRAEHDCIAREFKANEKVWANPETGRKVLAEDCTNPVGLPAQLAECGHILVNISAQETALRLKAYEYGVLPEERQCSGVKRPGEADYESPYVEECPEALCNFLNVDLGLNPLGYQGKRMGSLATVAGVYDFLVPRAAAASKSPYVFAFCTERWRGPAPTLPAAISQNASPQVRAQFMRDREAYMAKIREWGLTHSCATIVRGVDYVENMGVPVAMIYYDEDAARKAGARDTAGKPTQLYWHWIDAYGQCVVSVE